MTEPRTPESRVAGRAMPTLSLLTGSLVWGLIWYPYRQLSDWGLESAAASLATYSVALILSMLTVKWSELRASPNWQLVLLALSAGATNVGFVWATTHGEVLRVVLLFYLVPVWTAGFAWCLLGERITATGASVAFLALLGAGVMLWNPELGSPLPQDAADWVGLGAGVGFGLSNVLLRRASGYSPRIKSLWVFAGCVTIGVGLLVLKPSGNALLVAPIGPLVLLVAILGALLYQVNLVVQYGIERLAANRVPVIFVFEIVVAAASSWFFAGEQFGLKELAGGTMIVLASLMSHRISATEPSGTLPQTA